MLSRCLTGLLLRDPRRREDERNGRMERRPNKTTARGPSAYNFGSCESTIVEGTQLDPTSWVTKPHRPTPFQIMHVRATPSSRRTDAAVIARSFGRCPMLRTEATEAALARSDDAHVMGLRESGTASDATGPTTALLRKRSYFFIYCPVLLVRMFVRRRHLR